MNVRALLLGALAFAGVAAGAKPTDNYKDTPVVRNAKPTDNYKDTPVVRNAKPTDNYKDTPVVRNAKPTDNYKDTPVVRNAARKLSDEAMKPQPMMLRGAKPDQ